MIGKMRRARMIREIMAGGKSRTRWTDEELDPAKAQEVRPAFTSVHWWWRFAGYNATARPKHRRRGQLLACTCSQILVVVML